MIPGKHIQNDSKLLENPDDNDFTNLDERKDEDEEQAFKQKIRNTTKIAQQMSFVQNVKKSVAVNRIKTFHSLLYYNFQAKNSHLLKEVNSWAPFILQIAIGIHAVPILKFSFHNLR